MDEHERPSYAKQLLTRLNYLTLATVDRDGQPWNTPVFGAYDGVATFYWGSRRDAQHSQNVAENSRGFIVIYDSTVAPAHGEAFYARVEYKELGKSDDINHAMQALHTKFGKPYLTLADTQGDYRLYKAVIKQAWIKDPRRDARLVVDMDGLQ